MVDCPCHLTSTHAADAFDEQRYQTVYAQEPGAVAAPTAGLHFDEALLERCRAKGVRFAYVTLHVGAGTFQPVRTENLANISMHSEWYTIPQETVDAVRATQAAGKARGGGRHHQLCARWNRPRKAAPCRQAAPIPVCSSRPATCSRR